MKRPILFLFALSMLSLFARGQSDSSNLVITEIAKCDGSNAYVELTNMGNTTLDLSNYRVGDRPGNLNWAQTIADKSGLTTMLWGTLEPGKSILIRNVADDPTNWQQVPRPRLDAATTLPVYLGPEQKVAHDSVSVYHSLWRAFTGDGFFVMFYNPATGDSSVVDGFKLNYNPGAETLAGDDQVSGYPNGSLQAVCVRKFSVKKGNPDWSTSNGSSIN